MLISKWCYYLYRNQTVKYHSGLSETSVSQPNQDYGAPATTMQENKSDLEANNIFLESRSCHSFATVFYVIMSI